MGLSLPLPVGLPVAPGRESPPPPPPTGTLHTWLLLSLPSPDFGEVLPKTCLPVASTLWSRHKSLEPRALGTSFLTYKKGMIGPFLPRSKGHHVDCVESSLDLFRLQLGLSVL